MVGIIWIVDINIKMSVIQMILLLERIFVRIIFTFIIHILPELVT